MAYAFEHQMSGIPRLFVCAQLQHWHVGVGGSSRDSQWSSLLPPFGGPAGERGHVGEPHRLQGGCRQDRSVAAVADQDDLAVRVGAQLPDCSFEYAARHGVGARDDSGSDLLRFADVDQDRWSVEPLGEIRGADLRYLCSQSIDQTVIGELQLVATTSSSFTEPERIRKARTGTCSSTGPAIR